MSASKYRTRKEQENQERQAALVAFKPILEQLKDPFSGTPYRIQMLADEKAVNEKIAGNNVICVGEKLEEKGYPCKVFDGNGKASVLFYINAGIFTEIIQELEKEVAKILGKGVAGAVDVLRTTLADLEKFKSNSPEGYNAAILKIKDFCEEIDIIKSMYVEVLDKMYPPKLQEKYKAEFSDLQAEAQQLISKLANNIAQAKEQEKKAAAEAKVAEEARKKQSHETLGQILLQEVSGYRFQILGSSELALPNNQEKKTVYVEVNPPKDSQSINSYRCKIVDKFGKTHCIFSVDASSKEHAQLQIIVERKKTANLLKAEFKPIQADFFDAKDFESAEEHIQQCESCIKQLELYMEKIKNADVEIKAELSDTQKEAEALLDAMHTGQEIIIQFQEFLEQAKMESDIVKQQEFVSRMDVPNIQNEKVKGRVQTILGALTAEAVEKEAIVIATQKERKAWEQLGEAGKRLADRQSIYDSLQDRSYDPHANKEGLSDDLSAYITARIDEIRLAEEGDIVYGAIQTKLSILKQKAERLKRTFAGYVFTPRPASGDPKLLENEIYFSMKDGCIFCEGLDPDKKPYAEKIFSNLPESQQKSQQELLNDRLSVVAFQRHALHHLDKLGKVVYSEHKDLPNNPANLKENVISVIDEELKKAEAILKEESAKLKRMETEFESDGGVAKLAEMRRQHAAVEEEITKIDKEKELLLKELEKKEEFLKTKEAELLVSIKENTQKYDVAIEAIKHDQTLIEDRSKRLKSVTVDSKGVGSVKLQIQSSISKFIESNPSFKLTAPSFLASTFGLSSANQLLAKRLDEIKRSIDNNPNLTLRVIQTSFDFAIEKFNADKAGLLFGATEEESKAVKDFCNRFKDEYTNFFRLEVYFEEFPQETLGRVNELQREQEELRVDSTRQLQKISAARKKIQNKKIVADVPRKQASDELHRLDREITDLDLKCKEVKAQRERDVEAQRKVVEAAKERRVQSDVDLVIFPGTEGLSELCQDDHFKTPPLSRRASDGAVSCKVDQEFNEVLKGVDTDYQGPAKANGEPSSPIPAPTPNFQRRSLSESRFSPESKIPLFQPQNTVRTSTSPVTVRNNPYTFQEEQRQLESCAKKPGAPAGISSNLSVRLGVF